MENCVFCRIIKGEIPAYKIYEEEHVLVLLPKEMETGVHTLVIPKQHFESLYDIPENILADISKVCKKVAISYKETINATGINLIHASGKDAQQSVPHFHIHLLPRFKDDNLNTWPTLPKVEVDKEELLKKIQIKK